MTRDIRPLTFVPTGHTFSLGVITLEVKVRHLASQLIHRPLKEPKTHPSPGHSADLRILPILILMTDAQFLPTLTALDTSPSSDSTLFARLPISLSLIYYSRDTLQNETFCHHQYE
jgi:hypothetical protein